MQDRPKSFLAAEATVASERHAVESQATAHRHRQRQADRPGALLLL